MKTCVKCKDSKELDEFGMNRSKRDGKNNYCRSCVKEAGEKRRLLHREDIAASRKEYYESHREKIRTDHTNYIRKRYREDPLFRLKSKMYSLIYASLRGYSFTKSQSANDIVGLSGVALHEHLLNGFVAVYNRLPNDEDELDIDHIVPLATATSETDVIKLNHYSNLRYLLKHDNRVEKQAKLNWSKGAEINHA